MTLDRSTVCEGYFLLNRNFDAGAVVPPRDRGNGPRLTFDDVHPRQTRHVRIGFYAIPQVELSERIGTARWSPMFEP
jgi:hypothetical protein